MPKYLTITEAQQQLQDLPDEFADEPVITKHGKPVMAALSYEQFESLLETLDILSNAEFSHLLKESIAQAERGETISWEEAKNSTWTLTLSLLTSCTGVNKLSGM